MGTKPRVRLLQVVSTVIVAASTTGIVAAAQTPGISPDRAAALALNDLRVTPTGVRLSHAGREITFAAEELIVQPRRGPEWRWRLVHAGRDGGAALNGLGSICSTPRLASAGLVVYDRGPMIEQYVVKSTGVEQQFVIPRRLELGGEDLLIDGAVMCTAEFSRTGRGWSWSDPAGTVTLGTVSVFDAHGTSIPATMAVDGATTRIRVDGEALDRASFPVIVDPEIGSNDFRISDMGVDGSTASSANTPVVAYSSVQNEYLVVWAGADSGNSEIFGQRIDATTGAQVGSNDFAISSQTAPNSPAIAYSSVQNEYLVVWRGDGGSQNEVFGQRIDAVLGVEVGSDDFLISDAAGFTSFPAVAYGATEDEYLVVWFGQDDTGTLNIQDTEVFGQLIDAATGADVGPNDFRISDLGPDIDIGYNNAALFPEVAYNSTNNEFLVVWFGNDDVLPAIDGDVEVFGQRIDATNGAELGSNDFRISNMGPDDLTKQAVLPAVTYNPTDDEYLVVWQGEVDTGVFVDGEVEIHGQRLAGATGAEIGADDFRISDMGPDGTADAIAFRPSVVHAPAHGEYLVTWYGDDGTAPLVVGEREIFGQRLDAATGAEIGHNDFRISDMGPDGDAAFGVDPLGFGEAASAAYNTTTGEYLVVWPADDDTGALVEGEVEIYGQRLMAGDCPWFNLHRSLGGTYGEPSLTGDGTLIGGDPIALTLSNVLEATSAALVVGFVELNAPFKGGVLVPDFNAGGFIVFGLPTFGGTLTVGGTWPTGIPSGFATLYQYWITDGAGPAGFSASNGLSGTTP